MREMLKPYGDYKATEYDWLGSVPKHWKKTSIRNITELSNKRNGERTDLELLSVYREYGVIKKPSRDDNHNVESEDLSNYKYVDKGYLVLNKMKVWQGSLGVSKYEGIVSPAYIVCRLRNDLDPNFINYLLRAAVFKTIYNRLSYGVRVGQWDMRYDDFKNIYIYIPPKDEQTQIVRYLDSKLSKINKFIKAKKKQIELLKEQKQAIINQAVTKGLDSNVKMKPSGIEILGDIPDHWKVTPLKYIVSSNLTTIPESFDKEHTIMYIDISTVGFNELKQEPQNYVFKDAPTRARRVIRTGDTIISTVRTYLKSMCYVDEKLDGYIASTGFAVLTPTKAIYSKLLNYILSAEYFLNRVSRESIGVSYPAISESKLVSIKIAISPDIEEQREILKFIQRKSQPIDSTIEMLQKQISLITEYRTSLISNVVTGKVNVRDIKVDDDIEQIEELEFDISYEEISAEEEVAVGEEV